jgi:hypothetical protein
MPRLEIIERRASFTINHSPAYSPIKDIYPISRTQMLLPLKTPPKHIFCHLFNFQNMKKWSPV